MNVQRLMTMALAGLLGVATQAMAALPPQPGDPVPDKSYMAYAVAAVLIAGVCVATFKSSKRSHLD